MKAKKIAIFGLMGALAAVIGFFESALLPALPFLPPGAKPGLSNIVTTFAVAAYSLVGGLYVTLCKAAFVFLTRGVTAGLMSLAGGLLSALCTYVLLRARRKRLSFIGVGALSAACHNAGQLTVAALLTGTWAIFGYGKLLLPLAALTGSLTGIILNIVMPRLETLFSDGRAARAIQENHYGRKEDT